MTHAIYDPSVFVKEKQIAVPAHQFNDELKMNGVHQFVPAGEGEHCDAVQTGLSDGYDAASDQVLAQQHAECGCRVGVFERS